MVPWLVRLGRHEGRSPADLEYRHQLVLGRPFVWLVLVFVWLARPHAPLAQRQLHETARLDVVFGPGFRESDRHEAFRTCGRPDANRGVTREPSKNVLYQKLRGLRQLGSQPFGAGTHPLGHDLKTFSRIGS